MPRFRSNVPKLDPIRVSAADPVSEACHSSHSSHSWAAVAAQEARFSRAPDSAAAPTSAAAHHAVAPYVAAVVVVFAGLCGGVFHVSCVACVFVGRAYFSAALA